MNLEELNKLYPYSKPQVPAQLWLLAVITTGGLIALFFAALNAFLLVASNPAQAFFAALLIEAGLVIEALALINRPKTLYPWLGLAVSFLVSGTYNYTQAAKADQNLAGLELFALAFGPLAALASVSLTLGNELRNHQITVSEWERNRAEWVEKERQRLERKAEKAEERKNASGNFAGKAEGMTGGLPETSGNFTGNQDGGSGSFRQFSGNLPVWLPRLPASLKEFKYMVDEGIIILPPGITGADLMTHIPAVGTDRTGRNWLMAVGYRDMETLVPNGNGKH